MRILVHGILNKSHLGTHLIFREPGKTSGFTLLELLIVIVIISVLFSFMTLSIRSSSPEELIKQEARRFNQLIQLALDEAVLRNTEYGLKFDTNGYQFLELNENTWQTMDADKLLRTRKLPLEMEIELTVEQIDVVIAEADTSTEEDAEENEDKLQPQAFLMSSEEITPEFSVRFTIPGVETSYIVNATVDGKHTVSISDL